MTEGASIRRPYASGRIFLIALVFIGAAPLFWQRVEVNPGGLGEARENADLYQYVYPVYDYGFGRLERGEIPHWNPQQDCGTVFQADLRTGLFQPLNAIFLLMPTPRAMAVHAFASLALMGVFFALFARSLGVGYTPALIGALVYAFSGASAAAMSRPALAATLAWAPFVFWTVRELARYARPAGAVMAGLGLAALLLGGAPALTVVLLALLAAYTVATFRSVSGDGAPKTVRRVSGLLLAVFLALAVSAVQWAPSLAWFVNGGLFEPGFWNMHAAAQVPASPRELLLQFPMARAGTLPRLAYFGITTLLLIPAAFAHRPLRRHVAFFTLAAAMSFAVMLIDPSLWPLGFPPQSFAYTALFSMAVLAAIGADRLLTLRREGITPGPWLAAALVLVMSVAVFLLFPSQVRGYVLAFLLTLIPFLAVRRRWAAAFTGFLIAFLLFVDLMSATDNAYSHPYQDAPQCYARYEEAIRAAGEQARGGRAMVMASPLNVRLPGNLGMIAGLRLVGGRDLPQSADLRTWQDRAAGVGEGAKPSPGLLNYASARVLLVAADGALPPEGAEGKLDLRQIPMQGDVRLFLNEDALPRAYWVPYCRAEQGGEAALDALADPAFDGDRVCVVDASVQEPGVAGTLPIVPEENLPPETKTWRDALCSVEDLSPESVKITVNAPQAGIVVLCDTHMPAWEATVDRVHSPMLKVNGAFRGVAVSAGKHEIVFRHRALAFELASALSIATLALLSALGAAGLYRNHQPASIPR